jgi:hypothetical protein
MDASKSARVTASAWSSRGSDESMSIVPTTDRDGTVHIPLRAAVTSWSTNALTLPPVAPARPLSHVTLSCANVTEIARLAIV